MVSSNLSLEFSIQIFWYFLLFVFFFWRLQSAWHSSLPDQTLKLCLFRAPPVPDGRGSSHWTPVTEDIEVTISSPEVTQPLPSGTAGRINQTCAILLSRYSAQTLWDSPFRGERKNEILNRTLSCIDVIKWKKCFCVLCVCVFVCAFVYAPH